MAKEKELRCAIALAINKCAGDMIVIKIFVLMNM